MAENNLHTQHGPKSDIATMCVYENHVQIIKYYVNSFVGLGMCYGSFGLFLMYTAFTEFLEVIPNKLGLFMQSNHGKLETVIRKQ